MAVSTFPIPDPHFPKTEEGQDRHLRQLANVVRGIMDGKINSALDFELDASPATETTVNDERINATARLHLVPNDDVAATHLYSGTVRITTVTQGSFVLTHLPHPSTRSFRMNFVS